MRIHVIAGLLFCTSAISAAELQIAGSNELHCAIDSVGESSTARYFEDWFDSRLDFGSVCMDMTLEAHTPAFPASWAPKGVSFSQLLFIFSHNPFSVEVGTVKPVLTNGITLRMFEDRQLGWRTDLAGARFTLRKEWIEAEVFGGEPRTPAGKRTGLTEGGQIRFLSPGAAQGGVTAVVTDSLGTDRYWGSAFMDLYFSNVTIKSEYALKDFGRSGNGITFANVFGDYASFSRYGRAAYFNISASVNRFNVFVESKNYSGFELGNGAPLNNPPTVMRQHLFSLFSDAEPELVGANEKGWLGEVSVQLPHDNLLTVSGVDGRFAESGSRLFNELYAQLDIHTGATSSILAGAWQINTEGRYLLGGINSEWTVSERFALKGEFEHAHSTIDNAFVKNRRYFNQTASLSAVIPHKKLTLSLIGSATSNPAKAASADHGLYTKGWLGMQADVTFLERNRLTLFAGTRKDGKICAGGICVKKPEMSGVECTLVSSF